MKSKTLLTLAGILAASTLHAQIATLAERLTATTANLTGHSGETLRVEVIRWSTDAERDQAVAALEHGSAGLLGTLQKAPLLGYLWATNSVGYSIRYARRIPQADGTVRVVLALDQRLGQWDLKPWDVRVKGAAAPTPAPTDYQFTVMELRLNGQGAGQGKMSLATKVIADAQDKTLALENYATAPVLLTGIKHELQ